MSVPFTFSLYIFAVCTLILNVRFAIPLRFYDTEWPINKTAITDLLNPQDSLKTASGRPTCTDGCKFLGYKHCNTTCTVLNLPILITNLRQQQIWQVHIVITIIAYIDIDASITCETIGTGTVHSSTKISPTSVAISVPPSGKSLPRSAGKFDHLFVGPHCQPSLKFHANPFGSFCAMLPTAIESNNDENITSSAEVP